MIRIKRTLSHLGFDGWMFLLCGVAALVIVLLDFVQVVHPTNEEALRMIIVAIGLILWTNQLNIVQIAE